MFRLIKQCFLTSLVFLTSVNSLNCVFMSNQKCETKPQIANVNGNDPMFFFSLVLKQVHAVVVATISIIDAQNCVFLML